MSDEMTTFRCLVCDHRMKSPAEAAGKRCRCTKCKSSMMVPGPKPELAVRPVAKPVRPPRPAAAPARQELPTVPVKLSLPHNLGGMETKVTQRTANDLAKVAAGGVMVAIGVAVAAFFGIRRPSV